MQLRGKRGITTREYRFLACLYSHFSINCHAGFITGRLYMLLKRGTGKGEKGTGNGQREMKNGNKKGNG